MKRIILLVLAFSSFSAAQNKLMIITGEISYLSSQNIYVKFESTQGINKGDTLFLDNLKEIPLLVVQNFSSKSVSGFKIQAANAELGTRVFAFVEQPEVEKTKKEYTVVKQESTKKRISSNKITEVQKISGRISATSYSNLNNSNTSSEFQQWRYVTSFNVNRIANSNLSFSSYITFNYRTREWQKVKNNISEALKIYRLAINYSLSKNNSIWLGRRIHSKLSNIGVVDGISFENSGENYSFGAIAGSRPNFYDYGFNFKLFEFGGFLSREDKFSNGKMENTIAVFQQTNNFIIDRRFFYFQHSNNIFKNTSFFITSEFDIFRKSNGIVSNKIRFTGLYFSFRYNPVRWLRFSTSYDARKNVIYYETFKTLAEKLIDDATRQGFRFSVNVKPFRFVNVSLTSNFRKRQGDENPTSNYSLTISHSKLPLISTSFSISGNLLNTAYLKAKIAGFRISKSVFNNFVYADLGYKNVNYLYINSNYQINQNIVYLGLDFSIIRKLSLSLNVESIFEKFNTQNRIIISLNQRF